MQYVLTNRTTNLSPQWLDSFYLRKTFYAKSPSGQQLVTWFLGQFFRFPPVQKLCIVWGPCSSPNGAFNVNQNVLLVNEHLTNRSFMISLLTPIKRATKIYKPIFPCKHIISKRFILQRPTIRIPCHPHLLLNCWFLNTFCCYGLRLKIGEEANWLESFGVTYKKNF